MGSFYDTLMSTPPVVVAKKWTFDDENHTKKKIPGYYATKNGWTRKKVTQCDKDGNELAVFNSIIDAANETGVSPNNITQCISGRSASAGGFIWKKKPNERNIMFNK